MKIELRKIADIQPYPGNPRLNDGAVDAVAKSIEEFGFRQPIVVDEQGVIIVGHTRYKAAQKLGIEKVPVHVALDLSPEQIKAYRIADNKTAELAGVVAAQIVVNHAAHRFADIVPTENGPLGHERRWCSPYLVERE